MTLRAATAALLAALACAVSPSPGRAVDGAAPQARASRPGSAAAQEAPLAVTVEPGRQTVLPSGMVEMVPQGPSTGDADRLEPNIDGPAGRPAR